MGIRNVEVSYAGSKELTRNASFRDRVEVAMIKCALAIQSEPEGTPKHVERSKLAYTVLHGNAQLVDRFALAISTLDSVTSDDVSDADLSTAVSSVWNAFAIGG